MTSALLSDYFPLQLEGDREEKFIASGVTWQAYETLLSSLGNSSSYRLAYLSETLEIMSPSRNHELDKESDAARCGFATRYSDCIKKRLADC